MANIIVGLVILLIVALSISKVVRDKRKGIKCTGCAQSGSCSSSKK
ncbi:FeoB-associated Cys-rich membrane protein [Aliivibrio kagoshimensis]